MLIPYGLPVSELEKLVAGCYDQIKQGGLVAADVRYLVWTYGRPEVDAAVASEPIVDLTA